MDYFQPILPYDLSLASKRSISLLFILDGLLELLDWAKDSFTASSLLIFQKKRKKMEAIGFYFITLLKASKVTTQEPLKMINEIGMLLQKIIQEKRLNEKSFLSLSYQEEIYQKLILLVSSLYPFLKEAKANENLLFYLIENKEKWDLHLKEESIITILESFFSSFSELKSVIQEGFTRRGFSSFYQKNEGIIDSIEWDETLCGK